MTMEKYYIATLNGADFIGVRSIQKLIKIFGSAKNAWFAEPKALEQVKLKPEAIQSLINFREKNPDAVEKLIEFCYSKKIGLSSIVDEDYPPILKEIKSPPPVFYYRGKLETFVQRIAIVGTRHNTDYGAKIAFSLGEDLAAAGLTVVSGAAMGIDTFAHRGALMTGRTVAVLGCGISYNFPSPAKKLLDEISESGVVMTEFKPSMKPSHITFPPRNRIIAGLSRGVIVVEAGTKSGALITTNFAGDYSRDVFAVPGNIHSPSSYGCNKLIADGATLIRSAEDVLAHYEFKTVARTNLSEPQKTDKPAELTDDEKKIFNAIPADEYITQDEILMRVEDISVNEISSIILQLELKNCILESDGNYKRI